MIIRSTFCIVATTLFLASCTSPLSTPESNTPVEYPATQSGSPAAQYCIKSGGQVTYEKNPSIPTMDMIYCTPPGGQKIDAWKYMDTHTSQTGAVMTKTGSAL